MLRITAINRILVMTGITLPLVDIFRMDNNPKNSTLLGQMGEERRVRD